MSKKTKPVTQAQEDSETAYDFSAGKRGAVIEQPSKTRITIWIDTDVLQAFKHEADAEGRGYQTAMNAALKAALEQNKISLEERISRSVRQAVRDELALRLAS